MKETLKETLLSLPDLGWLLSRARKRKGNGSRHVTFLIVVSGFDGEAYGPFTLGDAKEFAEDMNGSIFECAVKEVRWRPAHAH